MAEFVNLQGASDIERADTLGCVDLMTGNRQKIDPKLFHTGGDFAHGLGRVRVHDNTIGLCKTGNLSDRLDRTHFVVGVHDRYKDGLRSDGTLNVPDPN